MSQSWDNVASMHLITVHAHKQYRAHAQMEVVAEATPLQLSDRYDKEQTLPLASLEALWLAPAPA